MAITKGDVITAASVSDITFEEPEIGFSNDGTLGDDSKEEELFVYISPNESIDVTWVVGIDRAKGDKMEVYFRKTSTETETKLSDPPDGTTEITYNNVGDGFGVFRYFFKYIDDFGTDPANVRIFIKRKNTAAVGEVIRTVNTAHSAFTAEQINIARANQCRLGYGNE